MKNILYFIPAAVACLFYGFVVVSMDGLNAINPTVWFFIALLIIAALLMSRGKCWGCVFGIIVGIVLIYMGMQETGQIFKEWPLGILFCVDYIIMGFLCNRPKKV